MKKVLLIAYHFPPIIGSSGVHRTFHLARHLPDFGWQPVVLTVHQRAYPQWDAALMHQVPPGIPVKRAQAWDAARHCSIGGRYPDFLALPDRWISWWLPAVTAGLRLIRRQRVSVLWSTFPVATAHLIGATLAKITRLPWMADFRDPMVQAGLPPSPLGRASWKRLERVVAVNAQRCCVTTPSTLEDLRRRYPEKPQSHWILIENGYDESQFCDMAGTSDGGQRKEGEPATLLHSGILYAKGRNPLPFFKALRRFLDRGAPKVRVVLRAPGDERPWGACADQLKLGGVVEVRPAVGYQEATREMMRSDGLLLFQGAVYNRQIPAKAYEYLRAGRPILALVDPEGDTMRLLSSWSHVYTASIHSEEEILKALAKWHEDLRTGSLPDRRTEGIERLSRRHRAEQLARIMDAIVIGKSL